MRIHAPFTIRHPLLGYVQLVDPTQSNSTLQIGVQQITYCQSLQALDKITVHAHGPLCYLHIRTGNPISCLDELEKVKDTFKELVKLAVQFGGAPGESLELSYFLHHDQKPVLVEQLDEHGN